MKWVIKAKNSLDKKPFYFTGFEPFPNFVHNIEKAKVFHNKKEAVLCSKNIRSCEVCRYDEEIGKE